MDLLPSNSLKSWVYKPQFVITPSLQYAADSSLDSESGFESDGNKGCWPNICTKETVASPTQYGLWTFWLDIFGSTADILNSMWDWYGWLCKEEVLLWLEIVTSWILYNVS